VKVLIDATWVGGIYGTKVMHGAYRVTNEYLKQLPHFPDHEFILTNTDYQDQNIQNLRRYAANEIGSKNVTVCARAMKFLDIPSYKQLYAKVSRYIPFPAVYPFVSRHQLSAIDVFHAPVDAIPGIIRRNKRIKKFFTAHDLLPLVRPDLSDVFLDYTKLLYDSLTPDVNILAVSENTRKDILKYRPDIHPDKIRVTHLGADKKLFYFNPDKAVVNSSLEKLGIKGRKYFLTVNSIARYKNVEFVVDHFMQFQKEYAIDDLCLVVIGQNREINYREVIEKKYGSADKVIILDYVDDDALVNLYNGALGFIYMSLYEGFGLPLLEAMQCGLPVICSNAASIPEVVGNAAIMIEPDNSKLFVEALYGVYSEPALRDKMIDSSLLQANKFSWENYAKETVRAYEEM